MKTYLVYSAADPAIYLKVAPWLLNAKLGLNFEALEELDLLNRKNFEFSQFIVCSTDSDLINTCHSRGLYPAAPINISRTPFNLTMSIGRGIVIGPDAELKDHIVIADHCILNSSIKDNILIPHQIQI